MLDVLVPGYGQALAVDLSLETEILRTTPSAHANCLAGQIVGTVLDAVRTVSAGSSAALSPADLAERVSIACADAKAAGTVILATPHRTLELGRMRAIVEQALISAPALLDYVIQTQITFRSTLDGEGSACLNQTFVTTNREEAVVPQALRALRTELTEAGPSREAAAQTILTAIHQACGGDRQAAGQPPDSSQ